MKLKLIEIPIFVMAILIALVSVGKNVDHSSRVSLSMPSIKEMATCKSNNNCIVTERFTREIKSDFNPIKEIKTFLRKKMY